MTERMTISMITLNVSGRAGIAEFESITLKEVLDEIRQFSQSRSCASLGDGFGSGGVEAWRITINGVTHWSSWQGDQCQKYNEELGDEIVATVKVRGGWYSFWDFNITTLKQKSEEK